MGGLLANPPEKGELKAELENPAKKRYRHPNKDRWVTFGVSIIERWYYTALGTDDPIPAPSRKKRADAGVNRAMNSQLPAGLGRQYKSWPQWSCKLHADNLKAPIMERPWLGNIPSYSTVPRRMQGLGWIKKRVGSRPKTPGQPEALDRLDKREVRGFESSRVHALRHLDFHHGGRRVAAARVAWHTPKALCILDDRSRLCCHIQRYLDETAETLVRSLTQTFHKRGLPRSLMTDNGSAMPASDVENGLSRPGIKHDKTPPYSPFQNGKQESFRGQLEGRLVAMLSKVELLTLEFLNRATQAWVEREYNRAIHEETRQSPLDRMLAGPDVVRPSPDAETLHFYFTVSEAKTQRVGDRTLQIKGVRFEVPSRFGHIKRLKVSCKPSDLSVSGTLSGSGRRRSFDQFGA